MLVLTRRAQEVVVIGNDIKVTVLGINGGQVRLGIEAPKHVTVDREEIHIKKQEQKSSQVTEVVA